MNNMASNGSNEHARHHSAFMDIKLKRKKWTSDEKCKPVNAPSITVTTEDNQQQHSINDHQNNSSGYNKVETSVIIIRPEQDDDSGICSDSSSVSRVGNYFSSPTCVSMASSVNSYSPGNVTPLSEDGGGSRCSGLRSSVELMEEVDEEDDSNDYQQIKTSNTVPPSDGGTEHWMNPIRLFERQSNSKNTASSMWENYNQNNSEMCEISQSRDQQVKANEAAEIGETFEDNHRDDNNEDVFIEDNRRGENIDHYQMTYMSRDDKSDSVSNTINEGNNHVRTNASKVTLKFQTPDGFKDVTFPLLNAYYQPGQGYVPVNGNRTLQLEQPSQIYSEAIEEENSEAIDLSREKQLRDQRFPAEVVQKQRDNIDVYEQELQKGPSLQSREQPVSVEQPSLQSREQPVSVEQPSVHSDSLQTSKGHEPARTKMSDNGSSPSAIEKMLIDDGESEVQNDRGETVIRNTQDLDSSHDKEETVARKTNNLSSTYDTASPLMSWHEFSKAAGISLDLSEKNNPLVQGFGLSGMSMMMGKLPQTTANNQQVTPNNCVEETSKANGEPNLTVTDWDYLSQVQQAQKEQINDNKKGSESADEDSGMVCDICGDRATGLHYGVISCEGCKGFFKRTVQNRRVYVCIGTGECEVDKLHRNRCQFCRFKKCLKKGMIMAAVREDRMPGGRNSGAVYNLNKMKYRKQKRRLKDITKSSSSMSESNASSYDSDQHLTSTKQLYRDYPTHNDVRYKEQENYAPQTHDIIEREENSDSSRTTMTSVSNTDTMATRESTNQYKMSRSSQRLDYSPYPKSNPSKSQIGCMADKGIMAKGKIYSPIEVGGRKLRFGCHTNPNSDSNTTGYGQGTAPPGSMSSAPLPTQVQTLYNLYRNMQSDMTEGKNDDEGHTRADRCPDKIPQNFYPDTSLSSDTSERSSSGRDNYSSSINGKETVTSNRELYNYKSTSTNVGPHGGRDIYTSSAGLSRRDVYTAASVSKDQVIMGSSQSSLPTLVPLSHASICRSNSSSTAVTYSSANFPPNIAHIHPYASMVHRFPPYLQSNNPPMMMRKGPTRPPPPPPPRFVYTSPKQGSRSELGGDVPHLNMDVYHGDTQRQSTSLRAPQFSHVTSHSHLLNSSAGQVNQHIIKSHDIPVSQQMKSHDNHVSQQMKSHDNHIIQQMKSHDNHVSQQIKSHDNHVNQQMRSHNSPQMTSHISHLSPTEKTVSSHGYRSVQPSGYELMTRGSLSSLNFTQGQHNTNVTQMASSDMLKQSSQGTMSCYQQLVGELSIGGDKQSKPSAGVENKGITNNRRPPHLNGHDMESYNCNTDDNIQESINNKTDRETMKGKNEGIVHPGPSTPPLECRSEVLLIQQLMNWEDFQSGLTKQQLGDTDDYETISDIYCKLGDEVMCEIVRWMKKLPFYNLISLSVHTETLEKHWHHVLLLATTSNQAWQQMSVRHTKADNVQNKADNEQNKGDNNAIDSQRHLVNNLQKLHSILTVKLKRSIKFEELFSESGETVEKVTKLVCDFENLRVTREEYVCLKVFILLNTENRVSQKIRNCYEMALKKFLQEKFPRDENRFRKLMTLKRAVEDCGDLLIEQKMMHVPFILN